LHSHWDFFDSDIFYGEIEKGFLCIRKLSLQVHSKKSLSAVASKATGDVSKLFIHERAPSTQGSFAPRKGPELRFGQRADRAQSTYFNLVFWNVAFILASRTGGRRRIIRSLVYIEALRYLY
jgi:hypothetical protein